MRKPTMVGAITLLLALWALPCSAQGAYGQGYPQGDYIQTCRNIHTDGDRLIAECQTHEGRWLRTSMDDVDSCRGQIVNNDGNLTCAQGGNGYGRDRDRRGNWQNGLPQGDYVQTCRNVSLQGDRLYAECQKRNGGWRRTSLDDVDRCNGNIANNNGRLTCAQGEGYSGGYGDHREGGWHGGIPSGTYTETCRNIRVEGDRLMAECQERDGDWRQTSLDDFQRCPSAPANDNGRLVCGR